MLGLSACTLPKGETAIAGLPATKQLAQTSGGSVPTSKAQITRDFLELSFRLENGTNLPVLTKFDEPVTVALRPGAPRSASTSLDALIARIRREARIDISRNDRASDPQIVIEAIPSREIQRFAKGSACFVTPNAAGWQDVRRVSANDADWRRLTKRTRATIIIPADQSPFEIRTCLHEELAQALGPLNDLFRLPSSVLTMMISTSF